VYVGRIFVFFLHPDACGMFARFCYFAAIFNEICGSVSVSEDVCSCKDANVVVVVAELPVDLRVAAVQKHDPT